MGGKGKRGVAQIAKRQERSLKIAQRKEMQKITKKEEKSSTSGIISDAIIKSIKEEISSSAYSSAWSIASKYGIKIGEAKRILKKFEEEGIIKFAYRSSRNPIFTSK